MLIEKRTFVDGREHFRGGEAHKGAGDDGLEHDVENIRLGL